MGNGWSTSAFEMFLAAGWGPLESRAIRHKLEPPPESISCNGCTQIPLSHPFLSHIFLYIRKVPSTFQADTKWEEHEVLTEAISTAGMPKEETQAYLSHAQIDLRKAGFQLGCPPLQYNKQTCPKQNSCSWIKFYSQLHHVNMELTPLASRELLCIHTGATDQNLVPQVAVRSVQQARKQVNCGEQKNLISLKLMQNTHSVY